MTEKKKFWLSVLAALALRFLLLPFFNFGDVSNSVIWGTWAKQFGLRGFYDFLNFFNYARPNQPPLTILLYDGLKYLSDWTFSVMWFINIKVPLFPSTLVTMFDKYGYIWLLKLPAIFSDIGLGFLIYRLSIYLKAKNPILLMNLFLFNPVSWYNSVIWGQTDSVLMLLGFSSLVLAWFGLPVIALIVLALTLLFKATLLTFLPIIFVIFLIKRTPSKKLIISILAFVTTVWLVSKPFAVGPTFFWLFNLYTKTIATGELPLVSANAFNFWNLIYGQTQVRDSIIFIGIPAFITGFIIFICFCIRPLVQIYKKNNFETILYSLVMIAMSAFLFLTRMHERYLYPVFIPLLLLAGKYKRLFYVYTAISVLMLINMYNGWWVPRVEFLVSFAGDSIVQRSVSVLLLGIFISLVFGKEKLFLRR